MLQVTPYHSAPRSEKKAILDEFTRVTGYHRKHAIRALRKTAVIGTAPSLLSRRRYPAWHAKERLNA
jgi:hypothetical protein